ncbi:MAG: hypothetical protein HY290_22220 [Planctomycetia bacterium]|nr:hypothetical protein [Planctomycetia bacterium]
MAATMAGVDDTRDDATDGDEPVSDEVLADLDRPLNEVLGIEIHFAPDDLAPPIDERRLIAFAQGQLAADEKEEILDLVSSFRSWHDALREVLLRRKAP